MENTPTSIWQSSDEIVDYDELEPETYQRIAEAIGEANPVLDIGCGEKQKNFGERDIICCRKSSLCCGRRVT